MRLTFQVLCISGKVTGDWKNAALFSISVAVGLVPEMLPAIVNANLARAAHQLSKKQAIVKRLDSVQNLGAMTVLCSDKVQILLFLCYHAATDDIRPEHLPRTSSQYTSTPTAKEKTALTS